ncbi:Structural maintenance of chromosomes protein 5 [Entophlyctis luteolus]|nr:Structural maintenance of chromosomes protein 5 [Entophlyctis luteolus]KAJ3384253.1 Structural maintenance of chromosomes protein 5 [Entophlyctis sp. JEL0112]
MVLDTTTVRAQKRHSEAFLRALPDYQIGAILKITLTNFVTYNHVEFSPGPYLNMVIGPNGTGKSTIVCAIALGLGGKPEILGRAKEIKEFVKKNQETAVIEIELKTKTGSAIIERSFKHTANTSMWKIDGM